MTEKQLRANLLMQRFYDRDLFDQWVKATGKTQFTTADLSKLVKHLRDAYAKRTPGRPAEPVQSLGEAAAAFNRQQNKLPGKNKLKVWA